MSTQVVDAIARAAVPGPVAGTRISEAYARHVARDAYFWAWPMMNIYNRRLAFKQAPYVGLMNGILPFAPLNLMSMLSDYVEPSERWVACPNQDVVYGGAIAALDETPVVLQLPDFGRRFWVYQVVDLRTDSFADLGIMYGSKPGFYLLAGPQWTGAVPKGINQVFTAKTGTGFIVPRVFRDDTPEDKEAVQAFIAGIDMYPLAAADGALTICVQAEQPTDPVQRANWLPAPKGDFSLYIRAYWPEAAIISQQWQPPAVQRVS